MNPSRNSLLAGLTLLIATRALGHTGEVVGLGSQSSAQAGAVVASASDFSAAYYNPAGFAFVRTPEITVGASVLASRLQIQGETQSIENPVSILVGAVHALGFGGAFKNRLTFGFALSLVPDKLVRVIARRPADAFFPLFDNRTQRLVALPGLAVRLGDSLAVGVAANILAMLDGQVVTQDGAARSLAPRVDEQIRTTMTLHAGLRFEPMPGTSLAAAYRQRFGVRYVTRTRNTIAGEPLDLDVDAEGLFTPHQIVGGIAHAFGRGPRVELDAAWLKWSDYRGPYVKVDASLPLLAPVSANLPHLAYHDIVALRLGAEQGLATRLGAVALRAGVHFEPSPVPDQPGASNQIDGAKLSWALGAGLPLGRLPLRLDAYFLMQHVFARRLTKTVSECTWDGTVSHCSRADPADSLVDEDVTTKALETSNVGYPSVEGGGQVLSVGLTLGMTL